MSVTNLSSSDKTCNVVFSNGPAVVFNTESILSAGGSDVIVTGSGSILCVISVKGVVLLEEIEYFGLGDVTGISVMLSVSPPLKLASSKPLQSIVMLSEPKAK